MKTSDTNPKLNLSLNKNNIRWGEIEDSGYFYSVSGDDDKDAL